MATRGAKVERAAWLASLSTAELIAELGDPRITRTFVESRGCTARCPTEKDAPHDHWRIGDGRPSLADEDPVAMCAIGRCATHRQRHGSVYGVLVPGNTHPERCGYCDYPLAQLLRALDWWAWHCQSITSEVWTWSGDAYTRSIGGGKSRYENPTVQRFSDLPASDQRFLVDEAVKRSRAMLDPLPPPLLVPRAHDPWCVGDDEHAGPCERKDEE